MPVISLSNNTEPQGPTHLNMIEMAAPSTNYNKENSNITLRNIFHFRN